MQHCNGIKHVRINFSAGNVVYNVCTGINCLLCDIGAESVYADDGVLPFFQGNLYRWQQALDFLVSGNVIGAWA